MELSKKFADLTIYSLLAISFLFLRPNILGTYFTSVGTFLLFLIIFINWAIRGHRLNLRVIDTNFLISLTIFWLGLLIAGGFQDSNFNFLLKAFISNYVLVIFLCIYIFNDKHMTKKVIDFFIILSSIAGYSSLFSILLIFLLGDFQSLVILDIDISGEYRTRMLFPFSFLYHNMSTGDFNILRFQSLFRESGISQAFYLSFLIFGYFQNFRKSILLGLIIGFVTSFSTAGLAISLFILPLSFYLKNMSSFNSKTRLVIYVFTVFILPFVVIGIIQVLYNIPYIGLEAKLNTHAASINDRLPNLDVLSLFGTGLYTINAPEHSGINLIKSLEQIGLIPFAIYIYIFTGLCWNKNNINGFKLYIVLFPIFITSLLSQPLIDAPFIYIYMFLLRNYIYENNRT